MKHKQTKKQHKINCKQVESDNSGPHEINMPIGVVVVSFALNELKMFTI